jgi:hypothetical protein
MPLLPDHISDVDWDDGYDDDEFYDEDYYVPDEEQHEATAASKVPSKSGVRASVTTSMYKQNGSSSVKGQALNISACGFAGRIGAEVSICCRARRSTRASWCGDCLADTRPFFVACAWARPRGRYGCWCIMRSGPGVIWHAELSRCFVGIHSTCCIPWSLHRLLAAEWPPCCLGRFAPSLQVHACLLNENRWRYAVGCAGARSSTCVQEQNPCL